MTQISRIQNAVDPAMRWAAAHPKIAAAVVAFASSWVLYGVLGKQYLGADDDYWPVIRNRLIPILDAVGRKHGFYAITESQPAEFVGIVKMPEEELEERLMQVGYFRNPLSSLKRSPMGRKSDGSWARRTGKMRDLGNQLRKATSPRIPFLDSYLARFMQSVGDIFAIYQIHITIYTQNRDGSQEVFIYAHREFNCLNPFVAAMHYTGVGLSAERGVKWVKKDFNGKIPIT